MNRRQFLDGVGVVAAALAGCTSRRADESARVVRFPVEHANGTDEPHTFHRVVEHDDLHYWSTHELGVGGRAGEMGGTVVEPAASGDPGIVEVHGRIGEAVRTLEFDPLPFDGERVITGVQYGPWGDEGPVLRGTRLIADRPASGNREARDRSGNRRVPEPRPVG